MSLNQKLTDEQREAIKATRDRRKQVSASSQAQKSSEKQSSQQSRPPQREG